MNDNLDLVCSLDEVGLLEKAGDSDQWVMYGWASMPGIDADKEEIVQDGLNFKPFVKGGWVNWDHKRDKIIGMPVTAEIKDHPQKKCKGLYVEYELLKGVDQAENVWKIAQALEKSNSSRRLGLSIEGKKVKTGKSGRILKADMYGLAVTPYPKNPDTSAHVLMKGMAEEDMSIDYTNFDHSFSDEFIDKFSSVVVEKLQKAISTGYDVGGTTQKDGSAIRRENLDGGYVPIKTDSLSCDSMGEQFKYMLDELKVCADKRKGKITKGEAVLMLQLFGMDLNTAIESVRKNYK